MPYSSNSAAKKAVSSLRNYSAKQVTKFREVFNALVADGTEESKAIPIALAQAKKMNKSMNKLEKATESDKRQLLYSEVEAKFSIRDKYDDYCKHYAWMQDYDDDYVYWSISVGNDYKCFKSPYAWTGTQIILGDEMVEVVRLTEYKEIDSEESSTPNTSSGQANVHPHTNPFSDRVYADIEKSKEDGLVERIVKSVISHFGGSKQEGKPIIKQLDDEQMIAIEQLYVAVGDVDGVGDTYESEEVMREMVKSFNQAIEDGKLKGNYFHKVMTDDFTVLKAWVTEVDSIIGDTEVKEGTPLVKIKFNNEEAWNLRKSGDLMGVSIGAIAEWEVVE